METGSIYALAALGIVLIFRTSRTTNFAQGMIGTLNCTVPIDSLQHCPVKSTSIVVLEYMIDETCEALGNCQKLVFENSGHSPYVDQPDLLAKEIRHFLKK